ncbi:hypothetical protein Tsubulata_034972 [Turnera subulata]|uniref:Glycosyltransferase subfamily 4-like N-terminal domain-containing protein n=1 Tax=Turnera subulata TaxID=218843 RepID=A0A9Q0FA03_9ROSI|nr:hypothetical protein Tsubulata_034972 [Turnera subulata]
MKMAFNSKPKKTHVPNPGRSNLCTTLFFIVLFTIPALFLLHTVTPINTTSMICTTFASSSSQSRQTIKPFWSGDLRAAEFAWNHLPFSDTQPPPVKLKIAVFSRKWPVGSAPGGMERHAYTLHTALSRRGHDVHVFTSPLDRNYAHHVAISDSCGEMLRDVYQIPTKRVHVILNGIDDDSFAKDARLGMEFRSKVGVPTNASLVLGVAGRLVKDKGHPLLHEAFPLITRNHPDVYLLVAGSGPWQQRYRELGPQVIVLGSMSPAELRAFYNAIDIFVNPTLRPQGLDLTLMEAMLIGKPIMASRFPSIKGTIVVEDEFGFMFSPNVDSLVEALEGVVMEGPRRLAQRGKACREYALSMFTARKMALAYERLFLCIKNETFCTYH